MGIPRMLVESPAEATVIVDDLIDSGATRDKFAAAYPDKLFIAPYDKSNDNSWLSFPWERMTGEDTGAEDVFTRLLQFVGEDPTRGGLLETPARAAKAWQQYTCGYSMDPKEVLKVFEDGAENYDEMVLVKNIPLYSHCEHHLAPIFGVAHVGYIANGKIVGLSKLSRLVDIFARRLQVQERLTTQIADALNTHLQPRGVGVVLECRHMCMEARGVQQQGHTTTTSALRGVLREDASARAEFMKLVGG
jgi:GTP cyclohydrolase I